MKIILFFLSFLSFTSFAFSSAYSPRWSPYESEDIVIYGKDGDFEILFYILDDRKFMGLGFPNRHPTELKITMESISDVLQLAHSEGDIALFGIPEITFASILESSRFSIINEDEIVIETNNLNDVYSLLTATKAPPSKDDDFVKLIEITMCHYSSTVRRAAVKNRMLGMSKEQSLKDLLSKTDSLQKDEVTAELFDSQLKLANSEAFSTKESLFSDQTIFDNFEKLRVSQCVDSVNGADKAATDINSRSSAEAIIADSIKEIFKNSPQVDSTTVERISTIYGTCLLDVIGNASERALVIWVEELNKTGSVMDGKLQAAIRIEKEGIAIDQNIVTLGNQKCIASTQEGLKGEH
jgi:hypothetical protein